MKKNYLKKLTAFIMAAVIVFSFNISPAVFAEGEETVNAGEILFKNSNGDKAYSFKTGDSVTVSCEVANDNVCKNLYLFVGLFKKEENNDRLVKIDFAVHSYGENERYTLTEPFSVLEEIDDSFYIKAFVMDDDLKPYTYPAKLTTQIDANEYFTDTPSAFRCFAPGIIRPDECSIQMTICLDRPYNQFGNSYEMPIKLSAITNDGKAENNVFAVFIPPLSESVTEPKLQFVFKNRNRASYFEYPFRWGGIPSGKKVNLAITWKSTGGTNAEYIQVYVSDETTTTAILGKTFTSDMALDDSTFSYCLTVDKDGPFHVSDIMISSKKLYSSTVAKVGEFPSKFNSDVTLMSLNGLTETTIQKSNWNASSKYNTLIPAFRPEKEVFYENEDIIYPVAGVNHSGEDKTYTVDMDISDPDGAALYTKTASITVPPDSKYHITEIPLDDITEVGLYKIHTRITGPDEMYREYDSSISVLPYASDIPDGAYASFYGHHINSDADVSVFKKSNVTATRMWLNEFLWSSLEPSQNNWQWDKMDRYVKRMEEAGIDMIGVLGYPSRWASLEPSQEERDACLKYEYRPNRWKPRSYTEWENYVTAVVGRYKGRIKYWEVYNEANFHPPYAPAAFFGTTEEYAELLRRAYAAAKEADPDCEILISGWSSPSGAVDSDMPLEFTKSQYDTGYFDIYNVHGYSGAGAVSSWLSAYRASRPGIEAFMTEEYPMSRGNEKECAYSAVKLPIDFLKEGYSKYFHFAMYGSDGIFFKPDSLSPTSAYQAAAVLQSNLRKCDLRTGSYQNAPVLTINEKFDRRDGKKLSIFGAAGSGFSVLVKGNIVSACDMYGREPVMEKTGNYTRIYSNDILYIVTTANLTLSNVKITSMAEIIQNGGFESLNGDVGTAGLGACTPVGWTYRNLDPSGEIGLSNSLKSSGSYSMRLKSEGGGRVYIFNDAYIPFAGTYELKFKMRRTVNSDDLELYACYFDRDANETRQKQIYNTETETTDPDFVEKTFRFTEDTPSQTAAALIVGIWSGSGQVYIDDVSLERVSD